MPPLAAPQAEQRARNQLCLAHAQALKQATADMEFKSTLPPISLPSAPQVTDVTDKMKRTMEAFHALRFGENLAFENYGRGSMSYLFALASIEHFKFRQLSTQEKRAWVKANSDNLIRSLPGWNSMTLRMKAERILFRQVRTFGTKHGGPFASVLGRDYVEETRVIEWRAEVTCHFDSTLPPDAPPKPRVDEQVPQVQRLLTQEHPQRSGVSKKAPIYVLPEAHQETRGERLCLGDHPASVQHVQESSGTAGADVVLIS
jgi:hypothetical protein